MRSSRRNRKRTHQRRPEQSPAHNDGSNPVPSKSENILDRLQCRGQGTDPAAGPPRPANAGAGVSWVVKESDDGVTWEAIR